MARRRQAPVGTRSFTPWDPTKGNNTMSFEEYAARHQGQRESVLRDRYAGATSQSGGEAFNKRWEGDVPGAINEGRIRIIPEAVQGAAPSTPVHRSPTLSPGTPVDPDSDLGQAVGKFRPDLPNRLGGLARSAAGLNQRGRGAMKDAALGMTYEDFDAKAGKNWTTAQKKRKYADLTKMKQF